MPFSLDHVVPWGRTLVEHEAMFSTPTWSSVVLEAPYGNLGLGHCLMVLAGLAAVLFLAIRPLLSRKLS